MSMKLSQTVKDLERVTVRPYLRERGFEGTGPRFERTVGETPQRIEVQRAKFDYMKGFVYLNGIISVPVLDQLLGRTTGRNITLRPITSIGISMRRSSSRTHPTLTISRR